MVRPSGRHAWLADHLVTLEEAWGMTLGARVRRAGFWGIDRLHGSPIRREYDDIKSKMSGAYDAGPQLGRLLEHATRTTDYYRPYAEAALADFPVTGKAELKQHDHELRSAAFERDRLHVKKTSGSTGTPVAIGQDARKRNRAIADTIYFNETAGLQLGDRFLWLQSWQLHESSRLDRLKKNVVAIDIMRLDDELRGAIVDTLRGGGVACVLGFASVLASLARYVEADGIGPDEFDLQVIISSAETLQPEVKHHIEAAFGCPVVDRYANEECGILACSRPGEDLLFLNHASFHFEFLQIGNDEPAAPGDLARVVVTDLYGLAVPLIRYDTGDLAVVDGLGDPDAVALRSVEGRRTDVIFDTGGRQIPPSSISWVIAQRFVDVAQYQVVQEDATAYRLRISLGPTDYQASALSEALHLLLGADAQVAVEFLDEIPSQPNGKYRPVVCRYVPEGSSTTTP